MANPLFKKPANVRYVDMAIWIDKNFERVDCDRNLAFKYMYLLAYMLASKLKYFDKIEDYDRFACYLAQSTYNRMLHPTKVKIKSVLNYMKSIIYFRKLAYLKENFAEIIDPVYNPEWNGDLYKQREMSLVEANNSHILKTYVLDYLRVVPQLLKEAIPDVYKKDKIQYKNIYISALLSFLSRITLPSTKEEYLKSKQDSNINFNDDNYYIKHLDKNAIVLWGLSEDLEDVVKMILNKTQAKISSEIGEIVGEFKIDEKCFNDMSKEQIFLGEDDYEY